MRVSSVFTIFSIFLLPCFTPHLVFCESFNDTLLIEAKMIGRVEATEKPELIWDYPEYERLFMRLEDEYELSERQSALERKLSLISRTAETLLGILQNHIISKSLHFSRLANKSCNACGGETKRRVFISNHPPIDVTWADVLPSSLIM